MEQGKIILFLFSLFIFLSPVLSGREKAVNKTPYRIPGKAEFRKRLEAAKKIAEKEKSKDPICLSLHLTVVLEKDHSGRVDYIEEHFLPSVTGLPLRKEWKNTFVELILPDGSYYSYHSPGRIPRIGGTLVYIKYSKPFPPKDTLHFLLDIPLDLPYRILQTKIDIASVKFEKVFHALIPSPNGKSISTRKIGRSTYLTGEIPKKEKAAPPIHLRLSLHGDWNTFSTRYHERYFSPKTLPPSWQELALSLQNQPELPPEKKLQLLASLLPRQKGWTKEEKLRVLALLIQAARTAGIEVFPVLATTDPFFNSSIAGDLFTDVFLLFRQEKREYLRDLTPSGLKELPGKFHNGTMLILSGNCCQMRKIALLPGKKRL